jgi:hypothetical protein
MKPDLPAKLMDAFREVTGQFPVAFLVTKEQVEKFFFQAGEQLTNFRGIPLEIEKSASENSTVVKTINGVLNGMHTAEVKEVAQVYSLLERMKAKFNA